MTAAITNGNIIPFPAPTGERREFEVARAIYEIDPDTGAQHLRLDARIVDGIDRDRIIRRSYSAADANDCAALNTLVDVLGIAHDDGVRASALEGQRFTALDDVTDPQPVQHVRRYRPTIEIRQDLVGMVDLAEEALQADDRLFTRADALVRVITPGAKLPAALKRVRCSPPEGAPMIDLVRVEHLRERIADAAAWVRRVEDKETGQTTHVDALPPEWVAKTLHARGEWALRPLDRVVETPTLRPDGTVITVPGYDAVTGILYTPLAEYPHMPDTPTRADALKALAKLEDLIVDFPFVAESDKSSAIGLMLTIGGRPAIPGPVPMLAARAPTPGTGKGKLIDACTLAMTGRPPTLMMPIASDNDDEWRKSLLSLALAGYPVINIDNVKGTLGSPSLAAALTTGSITGRILGISRTATVPFAAVLTTTGNNIAFTDDLGRRVIPSDLDAGVEHPEERTHFKHADLLDHARHEHPTYVTAALTILRAYFCAGRPGHGRSKFGSYEHWDDLIRGAIIWLGLTDPCEGRGRIQAESDVDALAISDVLHAWRAAYGSMPTTITDAINACRPDPRTRISQLPTLYDALTSACGREPTARIVAARYRAWRGRIVGGLRLAMSGTAHGGAATWRVEVVAP